MSSLQVRDLPEDVHAALVRAAAAEHRSLSQQTVVELRKTLIGEGEPSRTRRRALLTRLAESSPLDWDVAADPADLLREDRDR